MRRNIFQSLCLTLIMLVLCSGIYTLLVWGLAQLMPNKGKGELIEFRGNKFYQNIGQSFEDDCNFWSRPSAVAYNAAGSGGSNKGPSNPEYKAQVQARIDTFLAHNPEIIKSEIPADLVTASGSGLDPHISLQAAKVQVKRISKCRGIPENTLLSLLEKNMERPLWGLLGPQKINVLLINLELDAINN